MMNRRMSKILVLGALLMLALPVVALAQTSRVEGMALQGDYIKDYTGMFSYTSGVANVGNLVYGELGNLNSFPTRDRAVGAVIGTLWDGRFGTWAVHLHEQTPEIGQNQASDPPAPTILGLGHDPNTNTNDQFDIMWGKKFGTTSFGLRVDRSFMSLKGDLYTILGATPLGKIEGNLFGAPNLNFGRNIFGVGAGIGFEMSPTSNVEVNLKYESRTFTTVDTAGTPGGVVTVKEGSPTSYQLAARGMWQWTSNVMVVPVVKWYSYDLGVQTSPTTPGGTTDNTLKGWQLGLAGNWTLGANDLFVLGATFAQNRVEQQADIFGFGFTTGKVTETMMPEVFASLETHVNPWLTLRFGAHKAALGSLEFDNTATPTNVKVKLSNFDMALGAGAKFGNLQLDAVVNDNFPHVGPWFISGQNTGSPLFPHVTATYAF